MKTFYKIVIGALGGAVLLLLILKWTGSGTSAVQYDLSRTAVIEQAHQLGELATASFTIEKVIEAGTNGSTWDEVLFGDRILLIAHGDVVAGFDLRTLTANDIQVRGSALTIQMPAPKILRSSLDNSQTKVFDRKLGLLTRGDKDLESNTRAAAEASIVKAACEGGVLVKATENMKTQLTTLFTALGFTSVIINAPPGTCGA